MNKFSIPPENDKVDDYLIDHICDPMYVSNVGDCA